MKAMLNLLIILGTLGCTVHESIQNEPKTIVVTPDTLPAKELVDSILIDSVIVDSTTVDTAITDDTIIETIYDTLDGKIGDTLILEVIDYPSTGRMWTITQPNENVEFIKKTSKRGGLLGAQVSKSFWYFKVLSAGTHTVQLTNKRPFGKQKGKHIIYNRTFKIES